MELMYLFVGLLFGAIAARVRGFATWKGALGGLLLGPFALLLLFVSGDARCQACRRFIDPKATRCPYCTSEVVAVRGHPRGQPPRPSLVSRAIGRTR